MICAGIFNITSIQMLLTNAYFFFIILGYNFDEEIVCQEASGSPLVINGTIVGVVSQGAGCEISNFPNVYSRVAAVADWIKYETGIDSI